MMLFISTITALVYPEDPACTVWRGISLNNQPANVAHQWQWLINPTDMEHVRRVADTWRGQLSAEGIDGCELQRL
jgi:hypothetical protein